MARKSSLSADDLYSIERLAKLRTWYHQVIDALAWLSGASGPCGDGFANVDPTSIGFFPSQNTNSIRYCGIFGPPDVPDLESWLDRYQEAGVPYAFASVFPTLHAVEYRAWLKDAGFKKCNTMPLLKWDDRELPGPPLPVRPAEDGDLDLFEGLGERARGFVGSTGAQTLVATIDSKPAAIASIYFFEGAAYLGDAFTREPFRGRGAQTSLIRTRLKIAQDRGCDLVLAETYRFLEDSWRNLEQAGFVPLCDRDIYRRSFHA